MSVAIAVIGGVVIGGILGILFSNKLITVIREIGDTIAKTLHERLIAIENTIKSSVDAAFKPKP
jgi:hypothetical protein